MRYLIFFISNAFKAISTDISDFFTSLQNFLPISARLKFWLKFSTDLSPISPRMEKISTDKIGRNGHTNETGYVGASQWCGA